jgi:hypothetical protein
VNASRPAALEIPATRVPAAVAARLEALAAQVVTPREGPARERSAVHSVFPRAVNLRLTDGRLLALHGPGPLRAPFAMALARWPLPDAPAPGTPVDVARGALSVGSATVRWNMAPRLPLGIADGGGGAAARPCPTTATAALAGSDSWRRPLMDRSGPPAAPALRTPGGITATRSLARSIARADQGSFVEAVWRLIGLGEGLTPAGDDCVVGALAALHRAEHPLLGGIGVAGALRQAAWTRTTDVGREFLLHAVDGAFAEGLLDAVSGEPDRVGRGIAALLAGGASSGADTLLGLRLAARALGR